MSIDSRSFRDHTSAQFKAPDLSIAALAPVQLQAELSEDATQNGTPESLTATAAHASSSISATSIALTALQQSRADFYASRNYSPGAIVPGQFDSLHIVTLNTATSFNGSPVIPGLQTAAQLAALGFRLSTGGQPTAQPVAGSTPTALPLQARNSVGPANGTVTYDQVAFTTPTPTPTPSPTPGPVPTPSPTGTPPYTPPFSTPTPPQPTPAPTPGPTPVSPYDKLKASMAANPGCVIPITGQPGTPSITTNGSMGVAVSGQLIKLSFNPQNGNTQSFILDQNGNIAATGGNTIQTTLAPGTYTVVFAVPDASGNLLYYTQQEIVISQSAAAMGAATKLAQPAPSQADYLKIISDKIAETNKQIADLGPMPNPDFVYAGEFAPPVATNPAFLDWQKKYDTLNDTLNALKDAQNTIPQKLSGGTQPPISLQSALLTNDGKILPLQLYAMPTKDGWEIVDLSNPTSDYARTYSGKDFQGAWDNFLSTRKDGLPEGQIAVVTPTIPAGYPDVKFDKPLFGSSKGDGSNSDWISGLGWLSVIAGLLLFVPGVGEVEMFGIGLGGALLAVSSAAGIASIGLRLQDRADHGTLSWNAETYMDIVGLALNVVGFAGAGSQILRQVAEDGSEIFIVQNAGITTAYKLSAEDGQSLTALEQKLAAGNLTEAEIAGMKGQIQAILTKSVDAGAAASLPLADRQALEIADTIGLNVERQADGSLKVFAADGTYTTVKNAQDLLPLLQANIPANDLATMLEASSGDVIRVQRLISEVPNEGQLVRLLKATKDAGKLDTLLAKVGGDATKLESLLNSVKDADKLQVLLAEVPNADMLQNLLTEIKDPDALQRVLALSTSDTKAEKLQELLNSLKASGNLDRFVTALQGAQTPEAVARVVVEAKLGYDPAALQAIDDIATLNQAGKVEGFNDWLKMAASRDANQTDDLVGELKVARSVANDISSSDKMLIKIGQDDATAGVSFDITVVNQATGTVERSIEVKNVAGKVTGVDDLRDGITHAADKIAGVAAGSTKESALLVDLQPGLSVPLNKSLSIEYNADGTYEKIAANGKIVATGSLRDDTIAALNTPKGRAVGVKNLDQVTVYDKVGNVIFTVNKDPATGIWH